MLRFTPTTQFRRDMKRCQAARKNLSLIQSIILLLQNESELPPNTHDHPLRGNWEGYRELHVQPDWLLIYKKTPEEIIAVRTGSHSDLF